MKKLSIILFVLILAVVQYSCQEDEELTYQEIQPNAKNHLPENNVCGTVPFTEEEMDFMSDPNGEFQKLG